MSTTMVNEADGYFEMSDGRSPFKVPKKGLSEALQNKIRAMGPQKQKMADGGNVLASFPDRMGSGPVVYDAYGVPLAAPVGPAAPDGGINLNPPTAQRPDAGMAQPQMVEPPAFDINARVDELQKIPSLSSRAAGDADEAKRAEAYSTAQAPAREASNLGIRPKGAASIAPPPAPLPPSPAAKSVVRGGGAPMAGLSDIRGGTEVQKGAAVQGANAAAEQGRQAADELSAYGRQLETNMIADKQRAEAASTRAAAMMADYKSAQDEMRNINTTVDPGRFWASRSTAGKVAGIIGLALGALGAGPDGINRAAQMLNQAIDRDLEAQKAEHTLRMKKGQASIDAATTAYGMERQRFGDDAAASNAAKASLLGLAENNLKKISAGAQGPAAAAQAQAFLGQLQTQKGQLEAGLANTAFDNQTQRMLAEGQLAKTSGRTPAEAKAIREAVSNYDLMSKTVTNLESLINNTNFVTEKVGGRAAEMQGLAGGLLLQVKDAEKLGTLDRGSLEFAEKIIGDPGATFTLDSTKIAKLHTLLGQSKRRLESMAGAQR